MPTLQYSFKSVSTAGSKVLEVLDNTNNKIYSFPVNTGLRVELYPIVTSPVNSSYAFFITHENVGSLSISIGQINDFNGSSPAGNNYKTDYATLAALLP